MGWNLTRLRPIGAGILIGLFGILAFGSAPASACGCGTWTGPTVAAGKSPGGVNWRIEAVRHGHRNFSIEFDYSVKGEDMSDYGFGTGTFPSRRHPPVRAVVGSGQGPKNESDIAGIASWRTKALVLTMASGKRIRFKPVAAPLKLRKRWPWIRALRFFDRFFPGNQEPLRIAALNKRGKVIGRQRL